MKRQSRLVWSASFLPVLTFLIILLSLKWREVYQEVFAKGSVADSPLTLHKEGKLTDVLFNGSVYKDDQGNVLGIVIVARDITDQKRSETELIEAKVFAELATGIAEEEK
jgi:signal transduction histidine kinase